LPTFIHHALDRRLIAPADHRVMRGRTKYYQIFFNHCFGFVKASDVDVLSH
jgi:hypothetical protein